MKLEAGLQIREAHAPFAVRACGRFACFSGESDGHFFLRIGPAPHVCFRLGLEDHVVADQGWQPDGGLRGGGEDRGGEDEGCRGRFHGKCGKE